MFLKKNGARKIDFRKSFMKLGKKTLYSDWSVLQNHSYVHFLVYNLIRALMARVAKATEQVPRDVSFKAVKQTLNGARVLLLFCPNCTLNQVQAQMVVIIGEHKVGDRPERSEPRAVKRRPKAFKKLQHSRAKARQLNKYKG